MAFQPSPQQQDLFNWITAGSGSCVLEAVAGSGKTTTLIEALKLLNGRVFFGAYNKKIAEEIKARAPQRDGLFIQTMHAAGFSSWRRVAANVRVNDCKCRDLFRDMTRDTPADSEFETPVLQLVSYAKQAAFDVTTHSAASYESWHVMIDHFDVDTLENEERVIELAKQLLARSIAADQVEIDFDDMIYAPLIHKARVFEYDWVLIDEAQDTNAARRALALRMLKRGGRLIAVGDRHQAIYGFTGADADALDLIGQAVSAVRMPLTVSYRCPISVVAHAQNFVSHIQAHPEAPAGTVTSIAAEKMEAFPGDAILCRFNAPLLGLVYQFIAKGIPARIEGREIGTGLKTLARRWKVKTFSALLSRLEGYEERECAKYRAKEQESRAVAVEDKVRCLRTLITRVEATNPSQPIPALCDEIDRIFGQDVGNECVLLSTIHKSKGREWKKVYWLQAGASKWARKEWELQQEVNLCYVAATRAKSDLFLVAMPVKNGNT